MSRTSSERKPQIYDYPENGGGGPLSWDIFPRSNLFHEKTQDALYRFIHLSFGKAGPFTLESHIHVQALKLQGFSND